ncbi:MULTISPECIES: GNAT family N-acetyltransferase [Shewanella]|uniref:GNAT family N-acetyltransferase n=1 Tax=Shewanella TaxID=22 RepID=UPI0004AE89AF|nr:MULTISPECIES: GNAT family N-acetyltransferase [Shewanella]QLE84857.1 GNAT family N-acetyltransferase [Shewanella sp. Scap07]
MTTTAPIDKTEALRAVYLTAEDLRVAASILYNAYHDDPLFVDVMHSGDQVQYEKKLRGAIREELNSLWQQEQVLIGLFDGERLIGVACIATEQLPLGEARLWNWRLKMLVSAGWQTTQALMNKERSILEHLPSAHSGVLQFIAINPIEQGKGYGNRLVQAVISWSEEQPELAGIGVFAANDNHAKLFSRHDFAQLERLTIGNVEGDLLFYRGHSND